MQDTKLASLAAITSLMIFFMADAEAMARPIGVLGLYKVAKNATVTINENTISAIGCQLRHEGAVADEAGDIDIDKPNHFVFLACDDTVLNDATKRSDSDNLVGQANTLAILEGTLSDLPDGQSTSAMADREYILKVSRYNNKDLDAREGELSRINQLSNTRPDHFITESFIAVNHASGMSTPDEAVIIFYDNAEQGNRFRKNNPDILDMISSFNKAHLDDFIYYVGSANGNP